MKLDAKERAWTSDEDALLGTATDKEVGKLVVGDMNLQFVFHLSHREDSAPTGAVVQP